MPFLTQPCIGTNIFAIVADSLMENDLQQCDSIWSEQPIIMDSAQGLSSNLDSGGEWTPHQHFDY